MVSDFSSRLQKVENVLLRLLDRVDEFITNEMSLTNVTAIFRGSELQVKFEKTVLADFKNEIENLVEDILEWTMERNERQYKASVEYISLCTSNRNNLIIGSAPILIESRRKAMLSSMLHGSQKILERFNKTEEAARIRAGVATAFAGTIIMEAGAIGVTTAALSAAMFDMTGLGNDFYN